MSGAPAKGTQWRGYLDDLGELPPLTQKWEKDLVARLKAHVPKDDVGKVLEVGCSNGRWLRWFKKEYGCEAFGLDLEPIGLMDAKDFEFIVGNALGMPYKDGQFDVVFSLGLLEHFHENERFQILKEQCRILRKGGYLICQVPNLQIGPTYFWTRFHYDFKQGFRHFRTTRREIGRYPERLGLDTLFIGYTGQFLEKNILEKFRDLKFLDGLVSGEILLIATK